MARSKGSINLSNAIEANVATALDARMVVQTKADLTDAASFPYAYVGLITAVSSEGKAYILKALPTTAAENWAEIGADIDTSVLEAEIAKKAEGYIESDVQVVAEGDDVPLVEDQILMIKSGDGTKEYHAVVDQNGVATFDVDGSVVEITYDATNGITVSNPSSADIDTTEIEITTETVHKINSRLIPKGDKSQTMDYLEEALTVKEDQGRYKVGDVIPADTSLEDIIRNMLLKTNNPSVQEPKLTLTGTGDKLLESGATLNATLTATFDRGAVSPVYEGVAYRAGEATAYSVNGGGEQPENTFAVTVSESNKQFVATVAYAEGQEIKNDEGGKYMDALPSGTLQSNTLSYDFVDAMYSNASNINTVAKEALVAKSVGMKVFNFPPATAANPEVFEVPSSWSVISVEVLNEMSGKYEEVTEFVTSSTTHPNAANVDVAYTRYTDGRGYASGARTVRVKWS